MVVGSSTSNSEYQRLSGNQGHLAKEEDLLSFSKSHSYLEYRISSFEPTVSNGNQEKKKYPQ